MLICLFLINRLRLRGLWQSSSCTESCYSSKIQWDPGSDGQSKKPSTFHLQLPTSVPTKNSTVAELLPESWSAQWPKLLTHMKRLTCRHLSLTVDLQGPGCLGNPNVYFSSVSSLPFIVATIVCVAHSWVHFTPYPPTSSRQPLFLPSSLPNYNWKKNLDPLSAGLATRWRKTLSRFDRASYPYDPVWLVSKWFIFRDPSDRT